MIGLSQQFSRHLYMSVAIAFLISSTTACGGSEEPGAEDVGIDDVAMIDADSQDADVTDDAGSPDVSDPDADADTGPPDEAPETLDDYLICDSDLDCPINGSRCVEWLSFNRTDSDGTDEIATSEVFDDLDDGQGVCSRDCSDDPTVCDGVYWSDSAGQVYESSCIVTYSGQLPYEITSSDPFEVELDEEEMEEGQAFAAICLPPFDQADGRTSTFCAACNVGEDCDEDSFCYNAMSAEFREAADELGDSFCVESCESDADCPFGFDCEDVDGEQVCLPFEDTCTDCVDRDEDGYGTGHCGPAEERQTPFDCDDTNPDAFFDPDDMTHPFPEQCFDDPDDESTFYNDLNCSGVLDHEEQIGSDDWGQYHCTSCGDECTGETDGGFWVCMRDEDDEPYCGIGCEPGFATCADSEECSIDIEAEKALGDDQLYRDQESDYVWYDAPEGEEWATSEAEAHFFCDEQEALEQLDNPTQKRGCHPDEAGAHPDAVQLCDDIDWNCSGEIGPDDPETTDDVGDGQHVTVGESCEVPGELGICQEGTAACNAGSTPEMVCEADHSDYPVSTPYCTDADTTCDGESDRQGSSEFMVDDEDIVLVDSSGNVIDDSPSTVTVGDACEVPGALGECRIGEVRCGSSGLYCAQTTSPQLEQPGFDGIDHSCDGADRYLRVGNPHVIYVDVGDSGPNLQEAIELAADCGGLHMSGTQIPCDVFVQDSSSFVVDETIELIDGVHVYGGFDTNHWDPSDEDFNAPNYESGSPQTSVRINSTTGLRGVDIEETTPIYGIDFETADRDEVSYSCTPNVGAICSGCDGLQLKQVNITAGSGAPNEDGPDSNPPNIESEPGEAGQHMWYGEEITYSGGHNGSTLVSWGGNSGTNSGETENSAWYGQDGWSFDDQGGAGGTSLNSPNGEDGIHGVAIDAPSPADSQSLELSSSNSQPSLSVDCPYVLPPDYEESLPAFGGGGGGSFAYHVLDPLTNIWWTIAAGGGSGGWAGNHGYGGWAGAPSIGFILVDTDAVNGISFDGVQISSSSGGAGGDGSDGTAGIEAAAGGAQSYNIHGNSGTIRGGDGGHGAGGTGGTGGNGGFSVGLMRLNSPIGSNHPGMNAGGGGSGGAGGQGGAAGGTGADAGSPGEMGNPGESCSHYRRNSASGEFSFDPDECQDP